MPEGATSFQSWGARNNNNPNNQNHNRGFRVAVWASCVRGIGGAAFSRGRRRGQRGARARPGLGLAAPAARPTRTARSGPVAPRQAWPPGARWPAGPVNIDTRRSALLQWAQPFAAIAPSQKHRRATPLLWEGVAAFCILHSPMSRLPEFDLTIDATPAGYAMRARADFAFGELPEQRFVLPFDLAALPRVRRDAAQWVRGANQVRRGGNEELREARKFGLALFERLFAGSMEAGFRQSRSLTPRGDRLRLRLRLPPELVALPWELLCDPLDEQFLALAPDIALVRYPALPFPLTPLQVDGPLHIVAVLASPLDADYPPLKLDREEARMRAALAGAVTRGQVALDVIRGPDTLGQLRARMRQPAHVLHIVSHGDLDADAEEGVLIFEDADGAAEKVGAALLRNSVQRQRANLRLVLLNACQGALPVGSDPFSSVGTALLRGGVPAVVAMQFEIVDDAAAELTRVFYDELAAGTPVDLALTEARGHLLGKYPTRLDWAVPVLFLRADDGALFAPTNDTSSPITERAPAPTLTPVLPTPDETQRRHYESLLAQQHKNLYTLEAQAASYGPIAVPLHLQNELDVVRTEIARLQSLIGVGAQQAPAPPAEPSSTLRLGAVELRRLWSRALSAAVRDGWEEAEALFVQIATVDPAYFDVQARLSAARRQLHLRALYQQAREHRNAGDWDATLATLDELAQNEPGYPDRDNLRQWANEQRDRWQSYERAVAATSQHKYRAALPLLEAIEAESPGYEDVARLLPLVRGEVAAIGKREAAERASQEQAARERAHRERFGQITIQQQTGNYAQMLDRLEALLAQHPDDREAVALVAALIENAAAPLDQRLRAGRLAGQYGDPRPGVCALPQSLDDRYWCRPFTASTYSIAEGKATLQLAEFRIARYPVTVWQYRKFVDAKGYEQQQWRTGEGWKLRDSLWPPYRWNDANWTAPNQPVIGVSWYEATAFCRWLTVQAKSWVPNGWEIRLPSEAEWEVAAMWDPSKRMMRPWQPPQNELWQNVKEAGIGRTSPVGMFPQGVSPRGALDMPGNVWEWCASPYEEFPKSAHQFPPDYPPNKIGPALRGGIYYLQNQGSGWGARDWIFPNIRDLSGGFRVAVCSPRRV